MALIFAPLHATSQKCDYNVMFSQDILGDFGMILYFPNNFVGWKETKIPMNLINCKLITHFIIQDIK